MLVLLLTACAPSTSSMSSPPPAADRVHSSATPSTAPSASSTPVPTAVRSARASWGDSASTSDIVSHLRAVGLKVDVRDRLPGSASLTLFGAQKIDLFDVENQTLSLYSFGSADQAESVFQLVSQRRETVTWQATPYFVKIGSNLAVLTTMDEAVARRVVGVLIR
jgi:hypothetical protein